MRIDLNRRTASWGLGTLGIALLAFMFVHASWRDVIMAFQGFYLPWLPLLIVLTACSVSLRAVRLTLLLNNQARFPHVWRSVCLGYFGSLFLPLGGGEAVKLAALRYETGSSLTRVATALTMDRMFDLCSLLTLVAIMIGSGSGLDLRLGPIVLMGAGTIALIALWLLVVISGKAVRGFLDGWAASHPGRHRWVRRFDEIHDQARHLGVPRLFWPALLLQTGIFLVDVVGVACGLKAFSFGHALPATAVFRLAFFTMIGFALPLLPGGFGSHQAASILALAPYGIDVPKALAISFTGETVHWVTLAGLGILAMQGSRLSPLRLLKSTEASDCVE
jgi:uncharacterized membrane protein YbhN (UPF0104 family)